MTRSTLGWFAAALLVFGSACGKSGNKCDPFQSPGMTSAEVDKRIAEAEKLSAPSGSSTPTASTRKDSKCGDLDVVQFSNGAVTQTWYLKGGIVTGYKHGTDAGGGGCSGEVPEKCP